MAIGACMVARHFLTVPYCADCDHWKSGVSLGTLHLAKEGLKFPKLKKEVAAALHEGDLEWFRDHSVAPGAGVPFSVYRYECHRCDEEAPVEIWLGAADPTKQGAKVISHIATATVPREATDALAKLMA